MRWGLLALVLLMAAGTFAQEPATAPSALRQEWDHSWVRIEPWYSTAGPEANRNNRAPGGVYQMGNDLASLAAVYQLASRGELPLGYAVVCCTGVAYPAKTQFDVVEYGVTGNEIRLAIRHRPSTTPHPLAGLDEGGRIQCFALAKIPVGLARGTYTFVLTAVEDREAGQAITNGPIKGVLQIPPPPLDPVDLKVLSNEQLLREYVARGEATRGTQVYPSDSGHLGGAITSHLHPARLRWDNARLEVRRRGSAIIPDLMEMLPAEVRRNAGENYTHFSFAFGFGYDLIEAMGEMSDPRPVPLLIDALGGKWDANVPLRRAALESLEKLTYVRFYGPGEIWSAPPRGIALLHRDRAPTSKTLDAFVTSLAPRYRQWLANEGRHPAKWLEQAKQRAREILAGDNADEIGEAIVFLQKNNRDDAPDQTLARLAKILGEFKRVEGDPASHYYAWRGTRLKLPIGNWVQLVTAYRGRARPLVPTLIDLIDQQPPRYGYFSWLSSIGGSEAMAYAVGRLPDLRNKVGARPTTAPLNPAEQRQQEEMRHTLNECRWMIECGAGRTFASDEELMAWWRDNSQLPQRAWLEQSLAITSARADAGDTKSRALLRRILPDLPGASDDNSWLGPSPSSARGDVGIKPSPPFRADWLKANREKLKYDDVTMTFRLQ